MILIDLLAGDVNNWRTVTFKYRGIVWSADLENEMIYPTVVRGTAQACDVLGTKISFYNYSDLQLAVNEFVSGKTFPLM